MPPEMKQHELQMSSIYKKKSSESALKSFNQDMKDVKKDERIFKQAIFLFGKTPSEVL